MTVALGFDIGGTAVKWALLSGDEITERGRFDTPRDDPDAAVEAMAGAVPASQQPDTVGVGVPGAVDGGRTRSLTNLGEAWEGFALDGRLAARLDTPVTLANDAGVFTWGEFVLGAGRDCRHLVAVTLGTGVGGGLVLDGRPHLGVDGRAGEIGHQVADPRGPLCGCGAHGCIEAFASAPAIVAAATRPVLQGVDTALRAACGGDVGRLRAEDVLGAARDGDPHAQEVVDRAAAALGIGIANLATILAPERIVIGGGLGQGFDVLAPVIERELREHARLVPPVEVVAAALGPHGGAVGAALWARRSTGGGGAG